AVAPILALFVASELSTLFWARYLLFTLPGFVLLAALTLDRYGVPIAAGGLLVLALLAGPGQTAIRTPDGHNHATTAAAGVIAANEQPGDGIAYALNEPVVPWEARDIVARYVPAGKRPRDVFALTPQRVDGHLTATSPPSPSAKPCPTALTSSSLSTMTSGVAISAGSTPNRPSRRIVTLASEAATSAAAEATRSTMPSNSTTSSEVIARVSWTRA